LSQSQSQAQQKISKKEAVDALWRKGVLHWKLHKAQKEMYDLARDNKSQVMVIGCSRQLGKSTFLVLFAFEECLRNQNIIVKFVAPKAKDIKRIIGPIVREITIDCPNTLMPRWKEKENLYLFPNGSEIQLAGTDNGHAESLRGNKAHLCIIDEAGFCDDLKYVINSILMPTMTRTGGKLIMASTPPKTPDHEFMEFFRLAEIEQRLIKKTIYDNPQLTQQQIDEIIARYPGGAKDPEFRREYLVEMIISEDDAVIPEFTQELQERIIKQHQKPPYYDSYVSMDIGGKDMTALLFAYYDFAQAKIIIEDEYVVPKKPLTDDIAKNITRIEKELWLNKYGEVKPPLLRIADNNNIILLNDLGIKHGIAFVPTLKDNADAALNNMRLLLKSGRIIINPKCKHLINHLQSAIWNKNRTTFARSVDKGHFDTVHALIYLCRNVNMTKNPYPPNYNFIGAKDIYYVDESMKTTTTEFEKKIKDVFTIKNPRKFKRY